MININDITKHKPEIGDGTFRLLSSVNTGEKYSLVFAENLRYMEIALSNENVSVIITSAELFNDYYQDLIRSKKSVIISDVPKYDYWMLHNQMLDEGLIGIKLDYSMGNNCQIHPSAIVSSKTKIGNNVTIGARVIIEDNCEISHGSVIHPGTVIGAAGLQTISDKGKNIFIKHAGGVKIGQDVQVLSNSIIQKSVHAIFTSIGSGTCISVLCSVGHNTVIGKNCNIAGNVLIGGSVTIGDNSWLGPSSTIKDGIKIGKNASIKIGSVVVKNIGDGEEVSGNFAYEHRKRIRKFINDIQ